MFEYDPHRNISHQEDIRRRKMEAMREAQMMQAMRPLRPMFIATPPEEETINNKLLLLEEI